jgi:hypothetical protein
VFSLLLLAGERYGVDNNICCGRIGSWFLRRVLFSGAHFQGSGGQKKPTHGEATPDRVPETAVNFL